MNCCICGKELILTGKNSNCSQEHIIPNAIGGILKSSDIYCKTCNSNFGMDIDKAFNKIFTPIVDNLDMHFDRKKNTIPYEGVMYDAKGNLYNVGFKNGKVTKMFNEEKKFIKWEPNKYKTLFYKFDLDNQAFKMGMSKIAFNFAVYNKIPTLKLNKIFDVQNKKLLNNPIVIPFVPMTMFDYFMEFQDRPELYHILRLFNYENYLFAYIELFSTFQVYVLLSDKYDQNISKEFCQSLSKNYAEKYKDEILEVSKISSIKDVYIILEQYGIEKKDLDTELKNNDFKQKDLENQIFQLIYEKIRHKSNVLKYSDVLKSRYENLNIENILSQMNSEDRHLFYKEFMYYTIYNEDIININKYKIQLYPDNILYPYACQDIMGKNFHDAQIYGYYKFNILMNHLKKL